VLEFAYLSADGSIFRAKTQSNPSSVNLKQGGNLGGAAMRIKVTLRCSECKQRNYNTTKNKKNTPDRLEMNKYCRFCRKHTVHNETK